MNRKCGIGDAGCLAMMLILTIASGCGPKTVKMTAAGGLDSYVADAMQQTSLQQSGEASLWVGQGNYASLFRDFKAREVNDMVTILVSESTQATTAADATSNKDSAASIGFNNLFGAEKKISELSNVVNGKGSTTFKGAGSTARSTSLSTTITARVKRVLPNGYLVIEGARELWLNNETQTVYLSGVVRPEDISARNLIPSGAIAQMEVRVQGRGVVSQPLNPGWLFRILNGVFPF